MDEVRLWAPPRSGWWQFGAVCQHWWGRAGQAASAAVERNTDRRAARGFVPPSLRGAETASRTVWAYRGCRAAGSGELDQAVLDLRLVLAV